VRTHETDLQLVSDGRRLVWHSVSVDTLEDLKARVTTMGASGTNSTQAFYTRLLDSALGTKMKAINGDKGLNDTFLAMKRGEIDGTPSVFYSAISSTRPNWIPQHLAKAILQYGPRRLAELPDTPFVPDLITAPDDKLLLQAAFAPLALGRPLVMPPGVPADRVAVMRKGACRHAGRPGASHHTHRPVHACKISCVRQHIDADVSLSREPRDYAKTLGVATVAVSFVTARLAHRRRALPTPAATRCPRA
jgi:hypothetical protein